MKIGTVLKLHKWQLMAQDKFFRDCIIQRGFSCRGEGVFVQHAGS